MGFIFCCCLPSQEKEQKPSFESEILNDCQDLLDEENPRLSDQEFENYNETELEAKLEIFEKQNESYEKKLSQDPVEGSDSEDQVEAEFKKTEALLLESEKEEFLKNHYQKKCSELE